MRWEVADSYEARSIPTVQNRSGISKMLFGSMKFVRKMCEGNKQR